MSTNEPETPPERGRNRQRLYQIIFESDTTAGRAFDIVLTILIILSVAVVSAETVQSFDPGTQATLVKLEWAFTLAFTIEYIMRLISVQKPLVYATSFFGLLDLIAILPTWLSIAIPGAHALLILRVFRLLRIFRILKLNRFLNEAENLGSALRASTRRIMVFVLSVAVIVITVGALMFAVEGPEHGFANIPVSMYWAVVTLTTVGYGDIAPRTPLGQLLASLVMILGYGIIAVPTGIVTSELSLRSKRKAPGTQECTQCGLKALDDDARFCKRCGARSISPAETTN